ncbi:hypothetical protein [Mesorhizobium jarvisii]|uniref:hypothetical protein n=1 Tax=Mesorhizobium jarvisii TaxID=1777867 RepID=UPI001F0AE2C6|nr:hypothetical protein [Mesorhizobium jarvisii]MCH4560330.1 hypothetical protein [Mesorhizobium jarvisii]
MIPIQPGGVKQARACQTGELVRFDGGGGSLLAVALGLIELDRYQNYLILQSSVHDIPAFSALPLDANHHCFSYGEDWVLEMIADGETFPGNGEGADTLGEIRIFDTSASMIVNVLDTQMRGRRLLLNLANYQPLAGRNERYQGARIQSWKIWASEDERTRIGGRAILEFPMPA